MGYWEWLWNHPVRCATTALRARPISLGPILGRVPSDPLAPGLNQVAGVAAERGALEQLGAFVGDDDADAQCVLGARWKFAYDEPLIDTEHMFAWFSDRSGRSGQRPPAPHGLRGRQGLAGPQGTRGSLTARAERHL